MASSIGDPLLLLWSPSVRGLGADVIADLIEAISTLALLTDQDTLATELWTWAEAISSELAECRA